MPETQWMTLTETADMMKTLPDRVTQMCEDGKLEYYMEDGRYFVSRESIDLFMQPPTGQSVPAVPDSNGTPRRQYGRAPHELEPSPESALDTQAVNDPDEVAAAEGSVPEDNMEEVPGRDMEETNGRGVEVAETAEDAQSAEATQPVDEPAVAAEGARHANDPVEYAQPVDDLAVTDHEETVEGLVETPEDAQSAEESTAVEKSAATEESTAAEKSAATEDLVDAAEDLVDGEATQPAEAAADPGETDVRVAEILADLRAALSRHAREHKAFCDEIAGLTDALESTLSRDDKTSELTREISSLLARYTRR